MKTNFNLAIFLTLLLLLCSQIANAQSTPQILWQKSATNAFTANPVAVSPNGKFVASQTANGIQIWNRTNGAPIQLLTQGVPWNGTIAFSPDGGYLAAGYGGGGVKLWETTNWTLVSGFATAQQGPAIAFSPDSTMIAIGSKTNIEIRTLPKYGLVRSWRAATNEIPSLAWSPDGSKIASGSDYRNLDNRLKMWDAATGNLLWAVPTAQTYAVGCIAFSPDGTTVATGNGSFNFAGAIQLWRVSDGVLLRTFPENGSCVAFSRDGSTLATFATNIVFRSVSDGSLIQSYTDGFESNRYSRSLAFTPDGYTFVRARAFGDVYAARVPFTLHPLTQTGGQLRLRWSGALGPFQLQQKTNLTDPWQNIGAPITNQTIDLPNESPSSFYRIIAAP